MTFTRFRETTLPGTPMTFTRNKSVTTLVSKTTLPSNSTVVNSVLSNTAVIPGKTKWIHDCVTPNFKKLVAAGRIINSPMMQYTKEETNPTLYIDYSRKVYNHMQTTLGVQTEGLYQDTTVSGVQDTKACTLVGYLPVTPSFSTDRVRDLAVTSAWASINDSDLLIGAAIAESGKTTRDLLTLARKCIKVFRAIKKPSLRTLKFNKKSIKAAADESEQLYMQARYNLRPLYYDILGVMKLTDRPAPNPRFTYRGSASDDVTNSDYLESRPTTTFPGVVFQHNRSSAYEVEARAGILCELQDTTLWKQMGISLFSETAWELTPFSFILDWFGNFGQVISSWAPKPGVKILTSWVTIMTKSHQTNAVSVGPYEDVVSPVFNLGKTARTETTFNAGSMGRTNYISTRDRYVSPARALHPSLLIRMNTLKSLDLAIIGKNLLKQINLLR